MLKSDHVSAYLARINCDADVSPCLPTLRKLHLAHIFSVPFENLSIARGEPIVLTDSALFDKIVTRRRGGFCYELNGLYCNLLRSIGFNTVKIAARVMRPHGSFGPPGDHMAILVNLEKRWLVDVGFGEEFRAPLEIDTPETQSVGGAYYRIEPDSNNDFVLSKFNENGEWIPKYRFSEEPRDYSEFEEMCDWHRVSPDAPFTHGDFCVRSTSRGHLVLTRNKFIEVDSTYRQEIAVESEEHYLELLANQFGIKW